MQPVFPNQQGIRANKFLINYPIISVCEVSLILKWRICIIIQRAGRRMADLYNYSTPFFHKNMADYTNSSSKREKFKFLN
jgi:hypothetical protein